MRFSRIRLRSPLAIGIASIGCCGSSTGTWKIKPFCFAVKQAALEERIEEAERRRDRALTAGGRAKEEEAVLHFRRQIRHLSDRIATLERGDDPDYQLWRNRLHERRFRKPEVHRILVVEFEITGALSQPC